MKYGVWLKEWVEVYKKPFIKSYKNILDVIRLHIPSDVKSKELKDLTPFILQKVINAVKTSRMRIEVFDVLHGSLSMAFKNGFIERDISNFLIKPKHVRKVGNALTSIELKLFLTAIKGNRYENYFLFLLYTGARRQEALDFCYKDISLKDNTLLLRGSKTEKSFRYVPCFEIIYEILGFENKQDYLEKIDYIKEKRPFRFSASRISREFKDLCPKHKLHDLRHTFATRCLECGISMKVVQEWMGHSRLDTTAHIYSHVLPEFSSKESQKFKLF